MSTELPLLSSPLKLIQSPTKESGVLLYVPIFQPDVARSIDSLKGVLILVLKNEMVLAKVHQELIGKSFLLLVRDQHSKQSIYGIEPSAAELKKLAPYKCIIKAKSLLANDYGQ